MNSTLLCKTGTLLLLGLVACKKNTLEVATPALVYTTVSTLAGTGTTGFIDGAGVSAQFSGPEGAAIDTQGNVYIADGGNSSIRKITPVGIVTTLAGTGASGLVNGAGATARFASPVDVAIDNQDNLYVADQQNQCIRKITSAGIVSTLAGTGAAGFADGSGNSARFNFPNGVAVDAQGIVYVADSRNYRLRKIMPDGTVSTLAGTGQRGFADGPGSTAQFDALEGIVLDPKGLLYVVDWGGNRIRRVAANGTVSTLAGTGANGHVDGAGSSAQFNYPNGITRDAQGNLYVTDIGSHYIRKITEAGVVSTLTGTGQEGFANGSVATAQFLYPTGITIDAQGTLYVTEGRQRIRKITAH